MDQAFQRTRGRTNSVSSFTTQEACVSYVAFFWHSCGANLQDKSCELARAKVVIGCLATSLLVKPKGHIAMFYSLAQCRQKCSSQFVLHPMPIYKKNTLYKSTNKKHEKEQHSCDSGAVTCQFLFSLWLSDLFDESRQGEKSSITGMM